MTDFKDTDPKLYGINHSNRNGDDLWGKNQFNSTFPVSLMCFMRDGKIPAAYLSVTREIIQQLFPLP